MTKSLSDDIMDIVTFAQHSYGAVNGPVSVPIFHDNGHRVPVVVVVLAATFLHVDPAVNWCPLLILDLHRSATDESDLPAVNAVFRVKLCLATRGKRHVN